MNRLHHWLCRSNAWRATLQQRIPWVLGDTDLGSSVLEVGPGPGLTTDILRAKFRQLTAVEIDPGFARALSARLDGANVRVVESDATHMPFADSEFSGAVSFTMLHHVPSPALQDKLLCEVFRVLRPGGYFAGCDSLRNWVMSIIHIGDTYVPVDPETFSARLQRAGFDTLEIQKDSQSFRFLARRPVSAN